MPNAKVPPKDYFVQWYEWRKDFDAKHKHWRQDWALDRLLWYLNSGRKRSYKVLTRPDADNRNEPRPDYICRDEITGSYITVEVKRIFRHPRHAQIEAHKEKIFYEISRMLSNTLDGIYILITPITLDTRGVSPERVAHDVSQVVLRETHHDVDTIQLPYGMWITKIADGGSLLLGPVTAENDEPTTEDPIKLMNFSQIVRAIRRPLSESNNKLAWRLAQGEKILLLDSQFWMLRDDATAALERIDFKDYQHIDRLYIVNVETTGRVDRLI